MADKSKAMSKDLRKVMRVAELANWRVEATRNGHFRWLSPDGATIVTAGTASDVRAYRNTLSLLRRHGLAV